jgi:stress response protein SCP2
MGLAWDPAVEGTPIDLDASCIWLDDKFQAIDIVWFQSLTSKDKSMTHLGDERGGETVGDDESIKFDLEAVDPKATYLCFIINSYSGQKLNDVSKAKCRLYNTDTGHESASFDISTDERFDCTALLMAVLYRAKQGGGDGIPDWYMHVLGEPATGQSANQNIPQFQEFLKATPLVEWVNDKPAPPSSGGGGAAEGSGAPSKTIMVRVPMSADGGGTFTYNAPGEGGGEGSKQEVEVPTSCRHGDLIEVPVIDIFKVPVKPPKAPPAP